MRSALLSLILLVVVCFGSQAVQAQEVRLVRVPQGGIQPQVAVGADGTVHLVYFSGDPRAGDLYYVRRAPGAEGFSEPIRVNSQAGSAIAMGTIRGAQVAVGEGGKVHVAWNGSGQAEPRGPGGTPMLYTRLNEGGTAFEPQRNLITWAGGLDGGGALAADQQGRVYVFWHGDPEEGGETARAVYLARSTDGGRTFERERRVNAAPSGVCGCCGMKATVDEQGAVYVLYRSAGERVHRDMNLLTSTDGGSRFQARVLDRWELAACPMSSAAFAAGEAGVLAAWQTDQQVFFARVDAGASAAPVPAGGEARARKHPVLALGEGGSVLLAWTEGTGWAKGGALAWQLYDAEGRPTAEKGRQEGVPVWSLPAALVRKDGTFELIY